ncbi:hypothetical protein [Bosea sp. AS-1]|uniref:hypothetical protein n=1 Tax=Bosea sp. AS-1 TaxID=2015316 RepID=UPI000B773BDE|nr:hypothetical protein [Bosea sp. AS-1]
MESIAASSLVSRRAKTAPVSFASAAGRRDMRIDRCSFALHEHRMRCGDRCPSEAGPEIQDAGVSLPSYIPLIFAFRALYSSSTSQESSTRSSP